MRTAANGSELEYRLSGSGEETVVLVHGELQDAASWDATAEALSGRFRVLRYDLAGHGESAAADSHTLERHAADLGALLTAVGIGPCHLVGHSLGGAVAARRAAAAPETTLSLSLSGALLKVDRPLRAKIGSWLAALDGGGLGLAHTVLSPWVWGADTLEREPGRIEAEEVRLERLGANRVRAALELVRDLGDQRRWLRAVTCPTLVAVGSQDLLTSLGYGHEIVEWVRHGVLVTITAGGHHAPFEKPEEWSRVLGGFLERYRDFIGGPADWEDDEDDGAEFHDLEDLEPLEGGERS